MLSRVLHLLWVAMFCWLSTLLTVSSVSADEHLPPVTVTPGPNQAVLYFKIPEAHAAGLDAGLYRDWGLHLWNNAACTALTDDELDGVEWATPSIFDGIDENYGAYWILDLIDGHADCINFIVHRGDEKGLGAADKMLDLTQGSMAFSFLNNPELYYSPLLAPPASVGGASVHWVERNTLLVLDTAGADTIKLHYSPNAEIQLDAFGNVSGGSEVELLSLGEIAPEIAAQYPHLSGAAPFYIDADLDTVKQLLKGQLVVAAYNADGSVALATRVQTAGVLDDLYTSQTFHPGESGLADQAQLGAYPRFYSWGAKFKLWAPTAKSVRLHAYRITNRHGNERVRALRRFPVDMQLDPDTGIWQYKTWLPMVGTFYRYEITLYHPQSDAIETLMVTDPYSLSLSTNSRYSQFVNMDSIRLKPRGWDNHDVPELANPEDLVLYESHVRDFSALDPSNRYPGKYLAFTDRNSASMEHLTQLRDAGLNTVHLLPAFDIATINEDPAERVDITDTVGDLCALADAPVCNEEPHDLVLRDLLASYDSNSGQAQALMNTLRNLDSFNWGYDPFHYTVPEGSYATDAHGFKRIREFRKMVQTLHQMGLRVVMDVVYNHTNESGLGDRSVLDKIVPGYYHRLTTTTGEVETSTCCANTATENRMMAKLMIDSLKTWTEQYQIDGFRFDLMGHQPLAAMEEALLAVQSIDEDNYFYGEGWNFGEVVNDTRFIQAAQLNLGETGIGSFSDRLRDAVRGGGPFDGGDTLRANQGFANGLYTLPNEMNSGSDDEKARLLLSADQIRVGLAGNLADFVLVDRNDQVVLGSEVDYNGQPAGYTQDPQEDITYVSKHDNQTLWDNNQYKIPMGVSSEDRTRMQVLGLSFPMLGQGLPFIHMGSELLRSKSMQRDSFDSGDWYNYVDFNGDTNNWNVGLPREDKDGANWPLIQQIILDPDAQPTPTDIALASDRFKELLQIRMGSPLWRLASKQQVMNRVDFHNTGTAQIPGVIAMSIDDGVAAGEDLDPELDAVIAIFNGSPDTQILTLPGAIGFDLHPVLQVSADPVMAGAGVVGEQFTVPAFSVAVFVAYQAGEQGNGLPVSFKLLPGEPPYGDTTVFVRGEMNGWGETDPMNFVGEGVYQAQLLVPAGMHEFKIASSDWSTVDFGGGMEIEYGVSLALVAGGANLSLSLESETQITFSLLANDPANPMLLVELPPDVAPYGDTTIYLRDERNDWDTSQPLSYLGDGVYAISTELLAGNYVFKIASDDWSTVDLGGEGVDLGVETPLTVAGGNLNVEILNAGHYFFYLQASDPNVPLLTVAEDLPTFGDTTLYLRGEMNGFGSSDPFSYDGLGEYVISLPLTAGDYQFKVADLGWSAGTNFGGNDTLVIDGRIPLFDGSNDNAVVSIPEDGQYLFRFHTWGDDGYSVSLEAERPAPFGETQVFLRGSMNGWGTTDEMSYTGDGTYSIDLNLSAGVVEFKIASDDWSTVDIGINGDISVGSATQGAVGGGNAVLSLETSGSYRFDLNVAEDGSLSLLVSLIEASDDNLVAVASATGTLQNRLPCHQGQMVDCDLRIYQVMVESFVDGTPDHDYNHGWGNSHHQGDIRGIINSLDYIQSLGVNALWLTPIFDSRPGEPQLREGDVEFGADPVDTDGDGIQDDHQVLRMDATGYFARDYFAIDPNFGTLADVQELVAQAHARGLKVLFDGVFGHHKGGVLPSPNGLVPADAVDDPGYPGSTVDYSARDTIDFYKEVAVYWINEAGIDGWRLDQANQVPVSAWNEIRAAIEAAAVANGRSGYAVGEIWSNAASIASQGYGSEAAPGLDSNFNFPLRYSLVQVLATQEDTSVGFASGRPVSLLNDATVGMTMGADVYPDHAMPNLMLGNHDLVRFGDLLQRGDIAEPHENAYWQRHLLAFSFMTAYSGPVTLYYGDEIGDEVPGFDDRVYDNCWIDGYCDDHVARSSGKVLGVTVAAEDLDSRALALREHLAYLMNLRNSYPVLYTGARQHLFSNQELYVDYKELAAEKLIFAMNVGADGQMLQVDAGIWSDGALTTATDLLTGEKFDISTGLDVMVPALGARMLLLADVDVTPPSSSVIETDVPPLGLDVNLRGEMNSWGLDPMAYQGNGLYSTQRYLAAGDYEFKIASADWSAVNLGPGSVTIAGDSLPVGEANGNLLLSLATGCDFSFSLDASGVTPVLSVQSLARFADVPVYLRGEMNGWGTADPLNCAGNGMSHVAVELEARSYNFKFASEDWSSVDIGFSDVTQGAGEILSAAGADIQINPTVPGWYDFILLADNTLTINRQGQLGSAVYLRGEMNGWGLDLPFTELGAGQYSLTTSLNAGEYKFKIGSANWMDANYGGGVWVNTEVTASLPWDVPYPNDATLSIPVGGSYQLQLDLTDPRVSALTVTALP